MQVYKHVTGAQFRVQAIHSGQKLYVKRFALLRSGEFLCTLSVAPPAAEIGLRLTGEDLNMFRTLTTQSQRHQGCEEAVDSASENRR